MENDFTKLCWLCLTPKDDMSSILDDSYRLDLDIEDSSMSLYDLLRYVASAEVCYMNGPYLMCDACISRVHLAYKFKKQCEASLVVFAQNNLKICEPQIYLNSLDILRNDNIEVVKEEVDSMNTSDEENKSDDVKFDIEKNKASEISQSNYKSKKCLCPICGIEKCRGGFKAHMRRHQNVRNHQCPICLRKFVDKANMTVHMRIHTGVHPFACKVCSKAFTTSTSLKVHMLMHDDIRPFKCHICDYSTRTSSHLKLHIRRHVGIKNYHCTQCDYSACSKAEINYHAAKHSDNKCFQCKVCGKGFTRPKGLKVHETSHKNIKPYMCELCGRGFTQAHSLRSHLANLHKPSEEEEPTTLKLEKVYNLSLPTSLNV